MQFESSQVKIYVFHVQFESSQVKIYFFSYFILPVYYIVYIIHNDKIKYEMKYYYNRKFALIKKKERKKF